MAELDNFANGITLLEIPAAVILPLLVEMLKRLGLPVKWTLPAAVAGGGLIALLAESVSAWPQLEAPVRVLLAAVILGMAASGAYSQGKLFGTSEPGMGTGEES